MLVGLLLNEPVPIEKALKHALILAALHLLMQDKAEASLVAMSGCARRNACVREICSTVMSACRLRNCRADVFPCPLLEGHAVRSTSSLEANESN